MLPALFFQFEIIFFTLLDWKKTTFGSYNTRKISQKCFCQKFSLDPPALSLFFLLYPPSRHFLHSAVEADELI